MGLAEIAMLYWPVVVIAGLCLLWARQTHIMRLRKVLRWTVSFWAIALLALDLTFLLIIATCDGNALYGYGNCRLVPARFANLSIPVWLLIHGVAATSTLLLLLGGAVAEWRARRRL